MLHLRIRSIFDGCLAQCCCDSFLCIRGELPPSFLHHLATCVREDITLNILKNNARIVEQLEKIIWNSLRLRFEASIASIVIYTETSSIRKFIDKFWSPTCTAYSSWVHSSSCGKNMGNTQLFEKDERQPVLQVSKKNLPQLEMIHRCININAHVQQQINLQQLQYPSHFNSESSTMKSTFRILSNHQPDVSFCHQNCPLSFTLSSPP